MNRKQHLVFGLTALLLGIYGLYHNVFQVVDVFVTLIYTGMVGVGGSVIGVAIKTTKYTVFKYVSGSALLLFGSYAWISQWHISTDVLRGVFPPMFILVGIIATVTGINQLKA